MILHCADSMQSYSPSSFLAYTPTMPECELKYVHKKKLLFNIANIIPSTTRWAVLLVRGDTKKSIGTTYCAFCLFFFRTDLQIRPRFRSGRVTAHFIVLTSINLFSIFNFALFDLSGHFRGRRVQTPYFSCNASARLPYKRTCRSQGVTDPEVCRLLFQRWRQLVAATIFVFVPIVLTGHFCKVNC